MGEGLWIEAKMTQETASSEPTPVWMQAHESCRALYHLQATQEAGEYPPGSSVGLSLF